MARIKTGFPIMSKAKRTLSSGNDIAPYGSLLLLFVPMLCCDSQCRCLWFCVGRGVVAAASLYVLLGLVRQLKLLSVRPTF